MTIKRGGAHQSAAHAGNDYTCAPAFMASSMPVQAQQHEPVFSGDLISSSKQRNVRAPALIQTDRAAGQNEVEPLALKHEVSPAEGGMKDEE